MELKNYSLIFKKKELINNTNIKFYSGYINHILGQNGTGKSKFAQDLYKNQEKYGLKIGLISSQTNIPQDIRYKDLKEILDQKFTQDKIDYIISYLDIKNIDEKLLISKLSDGQKQKLKLLTFLLFDYDLLILDEITNALDKKTVEDIYTFFNKYIRDNQSKYILNITHNLSDLSGMTGKYFLLENKIIEEYSDKEIIINKYIGGI